MNELRLSLPTRHKRMSWRALNGPNCPIISIKNLDPWETIGKTSEGQSSRETTYKYTSNLEDAFLRSDEPLTHFEDWNYGGNPHGYVRPLLWHDRGSANRQEEDLQCTEKEKSLSLNGVAVIVLQKTGFRKFDQSWTLVFSRSVIFTAPIWNLEVTITAKKLFPSHEL